MKIRMINTTSCPSEGWEYKGGSIQDVAPWWASRLIQEGHAVALEPFPVPPADFSPVREPRLEPESQPAPPESFQPRPSPAGASKRKTR